MKKAIRLTVLAAFAMSGAALATTFTNPIEGSPAPDPFIVWDDATRFYYHLHTQGDRLKLYRARHAAGISRKFLENTELHKQKKGE